MIELAALIRNEFGPDIEYNVEGYPTPEFIALIGEVRPDQVTLVPDAPTSAPPTTAGSQGTRLRPMIRELKASGAGSLFMDPDPGIIATAATVGADRIELYRAIRCGLRRRRGCALDQALHASCRGCD